MNIRTRRIPVLVVECTELPPFRNSHRGSGTGKRQLSVLPVQPSRAFAWLTVLTVPENAEATVASVYSTRPHLQGSIEDRRWRSKYAERNEYESVSEVQVDGGRDPGDLACIRRTGTI